MREIMDNEVLTNAIKSVGVRDVTIQDEALLEAGRKLLLNSVDDSRNYCQQMITVAISAIPIYIALLKLWFPDDKGVPTQVVVLFSVPVFLFLLATLIFSLGYLPQHYEINVGNIHSIEKVRKKLMRYRAICGYIGFILFCLGTILGVMLVLFAT